MGKPYKHLSETERISIETLLKAKHTVKEIAELLERPRWTIQREINRNLYMHRRSSDWKDVPRYSANLGQTKYETAKKRCGRKPTITDPKNDFLVYIEDKIVEDRYSPEAAIHDIERKGLIFENSVCASTVRNYIKKGGIFPRLTMVDLPAPRKKTKKKKRQTIKRAPAGKSIEKRPKEIETREEFGHWEMDTVMGTKKDKKSLLVFTERKTLQSITIPLHEHTSDMVVKKLNSIERKIGTPAFRKIFKSITCDNGAENMDCFGLEHSYRKIQKKRTDVYYCHPYCASERGSNENENKMIRRWVPKKKRIDIRGDPFIRWIGEWVSDYPRKKFDWKSSQDLFDECCIKELGYTIRL